MILYVSCDKNYINGQSTYKSINDALDICKNDDEIHIYAGNYNESFYIDKEIKLKGVGKVIISSDNLNYQDTCFIKESCVLENLTFKAKKSSTLHLYACTDVIIKNCDFFNNEGICITIGGSFDFHFENCNIYSYDIAIYYNNMFKSVGNISKCKIKSITKYAIKSDKNGILDIINSDICSQKTNCICLIDESIIHAKKCTFEIPDKLEILKCINSFESNLIINNE